MEVALYNYIYIIYIVRDSRVILYSVVGLVLSFQMGSLVLLSIGY